MGKAVLIVDDEIPILEMLTDIVESQGWEAATARNGREALARVRERIFDAALIDFNLPDTNGVMLHRELRQIDDELAQRCVFVSGLAQSDENLAYYDAYGGFLSKPFEVGEVVAALEEALR